MHKIGRFTDQFHIQIRILPEATTNSMKAILVDPQRQFRAIIKCLMPDIRNRGGNIEPSCFHSV